MSLQLRCEHVLQPNWKAHNKVENVQTTAAFNQGDGVSAYLPWLNKVADVLVGYSCYFFKLHFKQWPCQFLSLFGCNVMLGSVELIKERGTSPLQYTCTSGDNEFFTEVYILYVVIQNVS